MKKLIHLVVFFMCLACASSDEAYYSFSGETMGTMYNITLQGELKGMKEKVDMLLLDINAALSTYEPKSLISLFNHDYTEFVKEFDQKKDLAGYFKDNLDMSIKIHAETGGAFEPTIMPLVNYWGFGYSGRKVIEKVDSSEIARRMNFVGLNKVSISDDTITKTKEGVELDFSAIAKGYAVDQIASLLVSHGIDNYYIEIGGDLVAKGLNSMGVKWRTGIAIPSVDSKVTDIQTVIEVSDRGIATSGNYRNYYKTGDGMMYSHTINPKTGYTEQNNLLSATIIAPTCALADAYATSSMVMGLEAAKKMITLNTNIEGVLIYSDEQGLFRVFDSQKNNE